MLVTVAREYVDAARKSKQQAVDTICGYMAQHIRSSEDEGIPRDFGRMMRKPHTRPVPKG